MQQNHYSEIGKWLRAAREQHRISVQQAAHAMHVRPRYIEALEEGNLSEMPGLAYTKGYLQNYASFLDLDKVEILRRFEQVEESLAKQSLRLPEVFSDEKTPSTNIVWGALGVLLLVYVIWWVALKPTHVEVSPVENFPQQPLVDLPQVHEEACFMSGGTYYPPCYMILHHQLDFLPLSGHHLMSIMDLPNMDWAITAITKGAATETETEQDSDLEPRAGGPVKKTESEAERSVKKKPQAPVEEEYEEPPVHKAKRREHTNTDSEENSWPSSRTGGNPLRQ